MKEKTQWKKKMFTEKKILSKSSFAHLCLSRALCLSHTLSHTLSLSTLSTSLSVSLFLFIYTPLFSLSLFSLSIPILFNPDNRNRSLVFGQRESNETTTIDTPSNEQPPSDCTNPLLVWFHDLNRNRKCLEEAAQPEGHAACVRVPQNTSANFCEYRGRFSQPIYPLPTPPAAITRRSLSFVHFGDLTKPVETRSTPLHLCFLCQSLLPRLNFPPFTLSVANVPVASSIDADSDRER